MQRGAGERHVRHVAHALVRLARRNQIRTAAGRHLPRFLQVQQRRTEGIDVAVARAQHAVVEQQPPLARLDGHGARTDLHALPGRHLERRGRHDVPVAPPIAEVRRLGVENIPEGRMSRVTRTREHGELAADLPGEHHAVAVIGQKGVLQLVEGPEILGPRDADRRAVVAVAPRHVVLVVDLRHARIVAVGPLPGLRVGALQPEVGLLDVPLQSVHRETDVDAHAAVRVVAAENTGVVVLPVSERHDGRVENTVRGRKRMAPDDRVRAVTPEHLVRTRGTILPRHIGQCGARDSEIFHVLSINNKSVNSR